MEIEILKKKIMFKVLKWESMWLPYVFRVDPDRTKSLSDADDHAASIRAWYDGRTAHEQGHGRKDLSQS